MKNIDILTEDDKKNNNRSYVFKSSVILLLIIIIIILLLRGCSFTKTNVLIPTGDFDIFEININEETTCKEDVPAVNVPDNNGKDDKKDEDKFDDETGLFAYDEDIWKGDYSTNMFSHSSFDITSGFIAPGSTNVYKFIIKNKNSFDVNYMIKFNEINTKNIPMKFRLKRESDYVVGNDAQWVDASSLIVTQTKLSANEFDTYYLEWKWFDDDSIDTTLAIDDDATYSMKIKMAAEEA